MPTLDSFTALTLNGAAVTLAEALRTWKAGGQLTRLLDQLLEEKLVAEAVRQERVEVSDAELQAAADDFRQSHGLQKAADTQAWLARNHLTLEDLQARVEAPLLRRKLAERLVQGQTERYFAENRALFDQASLSQIVVDREGVAAELMSQIVEDGADIAALARKHSLDARSRDAGGFLGVLKRKSLSPPVESAVFGARPGQVVGPFKTREGYHIIKVEEILPAKLDDQTAAAIRDRFFQEWLRQRKARASVELSLLDLV